MACSLYRYAAPAVFPLLAWLCGTPPTIVLMGFAMGTLISNAECEEHLLRIKMCLE